VFTVMIKLELHIQSMTGILKSPKGIKVRS